MEANIGFLDQKRCNSDNFSNVSGARNAEGNFAEKSEMFFNTKTAT